MIGDNAFCICEFEVKEFLTEQGIAGRRLKRHVRKDERSSFLELGTAR